MTDDGRRRIRSLFDRLVDLPPHERASILDAECAGDAALRREIEDLLARDARTANLPVTPILDRLRPSDGESVIGAYRIERALGEGGFGEVFVAEQTHPLRRRVALKILKAGMDTKAVLARFEAERQVLALMDHPSIAKVHDAGETERGRPYFVMELVEGEPLTSFADRHALSVRDRLELFIAVAQAVQHAHQKGIIHRDLKPSNVLVSMVDGKAVPKVIDFGIAKATSHALTEQTLYTEAGQLVGTPEYMSPEQAEMGGIDVDTRTDVYSLGVVLYELLTGSLPFEADALRKAGLDGIRRIIREQEPTRPSTKVTARDATSGEAAARRATDARRLARQLRGDLDWIVLKAMEKDRARRYDSASALAEDIRRYLDDEPVLAGPPSARYRMGKFARRHRVALTVSAVVLVSILAALFESNRQRVVAQRARVEAERARDESEAVTDFLSRMLGAASPREGSKDVMVRDVLDVGAKTIQERFADQPLVRARLMQTMGNTYDDLGLMQEARPLMEEALALREATLGPIHRDVGYSQNSLAMLMKSMDEYDRADSLYRRALAVWEASLGPEHPNVAQVLNNLGNLHWSRGDLAGARDLLERSLSLREKARGPEHKDVGQTLNNLGSLYATLGDTATARRYLERAVAIREKALGPDHPDVAATLSNLAIHAYMKTDPQRAIACLERAAAIQEKTLGPDHVELANSLSNLAFVHIEAGDVAPVRAYLERALVITEKMFGPDHTEVAEKLINLGTFAEKDGRPAEARALLERGLSILERAGLPEHPMAEGACASLSRILRASGDKAAADRYEVRARAIHEKTELAGS